MEKWMMHLEFTRVKDHGRESNPKSSGDYLAILIDDFGDYFWSHAEYDWFEGSWHDDVGNLRECYAWADLEFTADDAVEEIEELEAENAEV